MPVLDQLDIAGVTADSRHVVPGDLFAALPGTEADGRNFIADAVRRGAVAVLAATGRIEAQIERLGEVYPLVVVKRGSAGCEAGRGAERWRAPAPPVRVVDTTGAGDLFAAGVLHGLVHGAPLDVAGRLGALAAAEIVSHLGAQPEISLRSLAANRGLAPPFWNQAR